MNFSVVVLKVQTDFIRVEPCSDIKRFPLFTTFPDRGTGNMCHHLHTRKCHLEQYLYVIKKCINKIKL